ncbi:unnamed protein product [Periconia digitata]|uniref:Uncharacterized protein n=1 Tax=Periconia digitata TaxID=1303443 RepID=A0A9W4U4M8_9PLEO|nr:unnamed protein product [Periconia digitata]
MTPPLHPPSVPIKQRQLSRRVVGQSISPSFVKNKVGSKCNAMRCGILCCVFCFVSAFWPSPSRHVTAPLHSFFPSSLPPAHTHAQCAWAGFDFCKGKSSDVTEDKKLDKTERERESRRLSPVDPGAFSTLS